ncbi:MAG: helix-turn-helix domain-containing protein [Clostridia bacterium]|nr:helix-turn-helix domain-containing protein [Clostridia bacterium]
MNEITLPVIHEKKYHIDKNFINSPKKYDKCLLFQIGRLFCNEGASVPIHAHINCFELTIITNGKGSIYTNGINVPVKRGDIFLSFPGDFHGIKSDNEEALKYDFYAFNTTHAPYSEALERIMERFTSPYMRIFKDETIYVLIGEAIAEVESTNAYSNELLSSVFEQVLIKIIRSFLGGAHAPRPRSAISNAETLCFSLMNYIDTHIYSISSLEELSSITNYNYSYLSALFKRLTGGTLSDYYRNRRLETSRLLLSEPDLSVTAIAELLGYSSIYSFSRSFKDKYGVSPEKYKKDNTLR